MTDFNRLIPLSCLHAGTACAFMLQETPGLLPSIFGSRPLLLFPAVLAIALFGAPKCQPCCFPALWGGAVLRFWPLWHAGVPRPGAGGAVLFYQPGHPRAYLQGTIWPRPSIRGCGALAWWCWPSGSFCIFSIFYPGYALTHHYLPKYFLHPVVSFPCSICSTGGLSQALGTQEKGTL